MSVEMTEIARINSVESINDNWESFNLEIYTLLDDDSYYSDFPDREEKIKVSRKKHKKLFFFLMDRFRDNKKVSFDFIKDELEKEKKE